MWRSAVELSPVTRPSWPQDASSRYDVEVLPLVPVVPNSSGGCLVGAVDPGRDLAERRARVTRRAGSAARVDAAMLGARGIGERSRRRRPPRPRRRGRAVALRARDADEEVAGVQVGGAERDAG